MAEEAIIYVVQLQPDQTPKVFKFNLPKKTFQGKIDRYYDPKSDRIVALEDLAQKNPSMKTSEV